MDVNYIDEWVCSNTFSVLDKKYLSNSYDLLRSQKIAKKLTIGIVIPTLEEENTIGNILDILIKFKTETQLLDEIIVIDGGSNDNTLNICNTFTNDISLIHEKNVLPDFKSRKGKGNQLWKGLFSCSTDIIIYIDSDLKLFNELLVVRLIEPLLNTDHIKFVKGYYEMNPSSDGRVTEICARPLINLLYPGLAGFIQPLSGEYAGFTSLLKKITYSSGYGVEMKILIEIYEKYGIQCMCQVNLLFKEHNHQPLIALTKMSHAILKTMLWQKLETNVPVNENVVILKNCNKPFEGNFKVRTDEHVHCNTVGNEMKNKMLKYCTLDDIELPCIEYMELQNSV